MKQKDIVIIVFVVIISALISLFVSKNIFVPPKNRQQSVDVVQPLTTTFPHPDNRFFNSNSYDPSQSISVGQNNNPSPFSPSTP